MGRVSDVRFEDIQILCDEDSPVPQCRFSGADLIHCNKDIVIENITRNGIRLNPEQIPLVLGEFDHNIQLR